MKHAQSGTMVLDLGSNDVWRGGGIRLELKDASFRKDVSSKRSVRAEDKPGSFKACKTISILGIHPCNAPIDSKDLTRTVKDFSTRIQQCSSRLLQKYQEC